MKKLFGIFLLLAIPFSEADAQKIGFRYSWLTGSSNSNVTVSAENSFDRFTTGGAFRIRTAAKNETKNDYLSSVFVSKEISEGLFTKLSYSGVYFDDGTKEHSVRAGIKVSASDELSLGNTLHYKYIAETGNREYQTIANLNYKRIRVFGGLYLKKLHVSSSLRYNHPLSVGSAYVEGGFGRQKSVILTDSRKEPEENYFVNAGYETPIAKYGSVGFRLGYFRDNTFGESAIFSVTFDFEK